MQKIGIAAGRPSEALFVADDAKVSPGLVRPNGPRKAVKATLIKSPTGTLNALTST